MKKYLAVLSLLLAALVAAPATSHALGLEAAVGAWFQDPSGTLNLQSGIPLVPQDTIDLEKDAGFDHETRVQGRAKIDLPLVPNIYLMATPMDFSGTGRKNVNFRFGDVVFTGGVDFETDVTLDHYDIALYYGIPFLETATLGMFNAEVGLNLRILDVEAEVTGQNTVTGLTATQSESTTLPVPMVYIGAQFKPVDLIAVEAEFRGITYDDNEYFDYIGRLKVKPFGPLFIAGGYRYESLNLDGVDGITADIEVGGPFVEAGIELDLL